MATTAELEAFAEADVPAELVDRVFDELRISGGDSENVGDVTKALASVQAPTTETASVANEEPLVAQLAKILQDNPSFFGQLELIIKGAVTPLAAAVAAIEQRLGLVEQAQANPISAAATSEAGVSEAASSGSTEPPSPTEGEAVSSGSTEPPSPTEGEAV